MLSTPRTLKPSEKDNYGAERGQGVCDPLQVQGSALVAPQRETLRVQGHIAALVGSRGKAPGYSSSLFSGFSSGMSISREASDSETV